MGDYSGYLQVDGYAGYDDLNAELAGCMAHARRKFVEAQRAQLKGKTGRADWAVLHIQKLYRFESKIKYMTPEAKLAIRKEKTLPLLKEFKYLLDKTVNRVAPKTANSRLPIIARSARLNRSSSVAKIGCSIIHPAAHMSALFCIH